MGSIRGFRCGECRGEVLATAKQAGRSEWVPPLLCCGHFLQPLDVGQILFATPPRRRAARCPRCGYEVRVIVHPAGALTCISCQADLVIGSAEDTLRAGGALLAPGLKR
jgi:hypothetical protein